MIQFAFILLAIVKVLGTDDQEELSKKLGACWMKTITDINNEKEWMGKIIQSIENGNKTQIYHKMQMSMILECESKIDISQQNYLSLTFKEVVKDFDYQQYVGLNPQLTKEEEALLSIIKKLEKDLGEVNKQNKLKQSYQQTQQIENEWQQVWEDKKLENQLLTTKPNYFHYFFFIVLIGAIFFGGYWSLKLIQGMNEKKTQKQKKVKS